MVVFAQQTICQNNHRPYPTTANNIHHFEDVKMAHWEEHEAQQTVEVCLTSSQLRIIGKRLIFQITYFSWHCILINLTISSFVRGGIGNTGWTIGMIKTRRPELCCCNLINILVLKTKKGDYFCLVLLPMRQIQRHNHATCLWMMLKHLK